MTGEGVPILDLAWRSGCCPAVRQRNRAGGCLRAQKGRAFFLGVVGHWKDDRATFGRINVIGNQVVIPKHQGRAGGRDALMRLQAAPGLLSSLAVCLGALLGQLAQAGARIAVASICLILGNQAADRGQNIPDIFRNLTGRGIFPRLSHGGHPA